MGVIVTEEYNLPNGLSVSSYYASINENLLTIRKMRIPERVSTTDPTTGVVTETITPKTVYTATVPLTGWVSKEAREAHKASVLSHHATIEQETPITGNVYELLYAKYKEDHPNSVDA